MVTYAPITANAALTRAFPPLLREVRKVIGERRATIVFDRGGWRPKLFRTMIQEGLDVLTYRKGKCQRAAHHRGSTQFTASNARRAGPLRAPRPDGDDLPWFSPAHALRGSPATVHRPGFPRPASPPQHYPSHRLNPPEPRRNRTFLQGPMSGGLDFERQRS